MEGDGKKIGNKQKEKIDQTEVQKPMQDKIQQNFIKEVQSYRI